MVLERKILMRLAVVQEPAAVQDISEYIWPRTDASNIFIALDNLQQDGLAWQPQRCMWQITDEGRAMASRT